jgi:hypothetical protein
MDKKWYYLSEMAVSDRHGGGLTLQRVLRDDLEQFDNFFHLSDFASQEYPIIEDLKSKQVNLNGIYRFDGFWSKHVIHSRDRVINKLKIQRYFEMGWEKETRKRIRKYSEHLLRNTELANSSWLVVPQNTLSILVLNRVLRNARVDYVTWMMDDHVIQWNNDEGWRYPEDFEDEFAFHLQNARKVLVISPMMARLYKDRFGVDSEVLFGPADPIATPTYQSLEPSGPVNLCYFGAIWAWQKDALEELAQHLPSVGAKLDIFTHHDLPASLRCGSVRAQSPVPAQEVMRLMREYDGVVITASAKEQDRNLTELNIATKMSECLASGTVTVIVGPEYAAMVQFVREHGGALVVSDLDDPAQVSVLRNLKAGDLRERLLREARRVTETVCSSSAVRRTWKRAWNGESDPPSL